ncbi:MAG: galactose oxidase, partial [Actinobacteria bacterium]|nr:galactose oxidase [Actinomycetota bacterium]NIS34358.1 galactose oxidase [Actinomycetota bacterium]NIU65362.1 galactose oxidase [Actinomycetota bacterium]NIV89144.1 galactose oxidase [Actinomycetota bacterium]NIW30996.1 galactose oxidase [Actinomycetota bacterium]
AVLFPPGIGSWETLAPLPTPRTENSVVALDGFIYVVGGLGDGRAELAVERYDPATDTWATVTSLPGGVDHAGLVTV